MNEGDKLPDNLAKYAVKACHLPALGHWMHDYLPNEDYDPHFYGQDLETTYFDTEHFALRKARLKSDRYLTLRIRSYPNGTYMLQAKTEEEKIRIPIPAITAEGFLSGRGSFDLWLPGHLFARLMEFVDGQEELVPVVTVCYRRYAIESANQRITLDTDVHTDTGRHLPFGVLECKGEEPESVPPILEAMGIRPIRISKFLWATEV